MRGTGYSTTGGRPRARSQCRFVPPLIHFITYSLTYSLPLFLKRQCDRTLGKPLAAGTHAIRIFKATEADHNGGSPAPNYLTFYGIEVTAVEAAGGETACLTALRAACLVPSSVMPLWKQCDACRVGVRAANSGGGGSPLA